ncbi:signal peptidase II [bacterium]|nr:signal peptidase II [bacterium]
MIETFRKQLISPGYKALIYLTLVMTFAIALDQVSKIYARSHFQNKGTIHVIGDFFVIHYAENNGSFLSMGSNLPSELKLIFLTIIPVLVLFYFIFYTLFNKDLYWKERITLTIIISGGISNIVDRIIFNGWVTDFIHFSLGFVRTGILNIADMYITFGVIFFLWFQYQKERHNKVEVEDEIEKQKEGEPLTEAQGHREETE